MSYLPAPGSVPCTYVPIATASFTPDVVRLTRDSSRSMVRSDALNVPAADSIFLGL